MSASGSDATVTFEVIEYVEYKVKSSGIIRATGLGISIDVYEFRV